MEDFIVHCKNQQAKWTQKYSFWERLKRLLADLKHHGYWYKEALKVTLYNNEKNKVITLLIFFFFLQMISWLFYYLIINKHIYLSIYL